MKKNDDWMMWAAAGIVGALALIFGPQLLNGSNIATANLAATTTPKKDCGCHMKK